MKPWLRSTLAAAVTALAAVAPLALAALGGCNSYNCDYACHQYYGEDACNRPPLVVAEGATQSRAEADCVKACSDALYTTTSDDVGGLDNSNLYMLENEADAMSFVQCVVEQDWSAAAFNATCEDLQHACP